MADLEIADAFEKHIRPHVVHVMVQIEGENSACCGTGTIFGCVSNPRWGDGGFVVTARHVVAVPEGRRAKYTITRSAFGGKPPRQGSFIFPRTGEKGGPRAFWYKEDPPVDLGAVITPGICDDRSPFLEPNEHGENAEKVVGVPLIPRRLLIGAGTRVAWAGYPEVAQGLWGEPILCYYEGVVAHTRNDKRAPLYLLDGHNDHGVSGGPVWWWNEHTRQIELAGVITHYCQASLSGFTIATAINPFRVLIEDVWMKEAREEPPA